MQELTSGILQSNILSESMRRLGQGAFSSVATAAAHLSPACRQRARASSFDIRDPQL